MFPSIVSQDEPEKLNSWIPSGYKEETDWQPEQTGDHQKDSIREGMG